MAQVLTREVQRLVNAIDRNTRGVAKLVSAMGYLSDGGVPVDYEMLKIDSPLRLLLKERRLLRDAFEKELKRQDGWKR